jgi:hypothetical protein
MNPITAFNLSLARIAPLGYARAVAFTSLPSASPNPLASSGLSPISHGKERSTRSAEYPTVRQVLRSNRREMTPAQRQKQDENWKYRSARKLLAKLGTVQKSPYDAEADAYTLALPFEGES